MKILKFQKAGMLCVTLICALAFAFLYTTCDLQGARVVLVDAATPAFTDEPVSQSVTPNTLVRLIAAATVPDGGEITYQWYSLEPEYDSPVGTPLDGETWDTYEVTPTEEGVYLYYVIVTNTNDKVNGNKITALTSNVIIVAVEAAGSTFKYPKINQQPVNGTYMVGDVDLKIEAEKVTGDTEGTLTFQWFSVNGTGNKNGARIDGAVSDTSPINIDAPGEYNYYCVVSSVIYQLDAEGNPVIDENKDTLNYGKPIILQSKSITSQTATITTIAELVPNATIVVNPNRKYQYVRGFGGMGDNSFSTFPIMQKIEEYETLFNPDTGLGLNMLRIMIMPENPTDNTDVAKTNDYYVNGAGNLPLYYEGVKIVNKYGGYVLASPWSPPPEWKSNNKKEGGGNLVESYYPQYAQYLRDFCQDMFDHGAPIYAISIQNEPNFKATYDGCEWTSDEMRDFFVRQGHFTTIPTAIRGWGGGRETDYVLTMNGESANHPNINDSAMDNPVSRAAIDVLGRHTYGDALLRYSKALDVEPKKEVWMTEHNINSGNPIAYPNDSTWNYVWLFLNDLDVSIRQNDESAFIWWYIRRFYSAIGDDSYGTVAGVVYPRGYGLSHYAKYAKETWRIGVNVTGTTKTGAAINTSNVNPAVLSRTTQHARVTAFVSPDGNTISLVMYTPTDTSGQKGIDMGTIKIQLPKDFIVGKADAMRSTATAKAKKEEVMLSSDKNSALVMLPPSTILSIRFTRRAN